MKKGFIICLLLLVLSASFADASTMYNEQEFTNVVGITESGWVSVKTTLRLDLTFTGNNSARRFTQEDAFMYAIAPGASYITSQFSVLMGKPIIYNTQSTIICPVSSRPTYYADPNWHSHDYTISTTATTVPRYSSGYANLGYQIVGGNLVYSPSGTFHIDL